MSNESFSAEIQSNFFFMKLILCESLSFSHNSRARAGINRKQPRLQRNEDASRAHSFFFECNIARFYCYTAPAVMKPIRTEIWPYLACHLSITKLKCLHVSV
jgi:hypothetical protein